MRARARLALQKTKQQQNVCESRQATRKIATTNKLLVCDGNRRTVDPFNELITSFIYEFCPCNQNQVSFLSIKKGAHDPMRLRREFNNNNNGKNVDFLPTYRNH